MKIKLIFFAVVVLVAGAWFIASTLKLEETTLVARYEMLACEDCNHMTVEKSEVHIPLKLNTDSGGR